MGQEHDGGFLNLQRSNNIPNALVDRFTRYFDQTFIDL
jgi:hypothetical protein